MPSGCPPRAAASRNRFASVLALDDSGTGEPLVLVHGLATTRAIWRHVVPRLARSRRVVAVDVPGFGGSPPAGAGFDLDAVARALERGLPPDLAGGRYDLVGHSMGAAVALALARRRPHAVRALVLVSPGGMQPLPPAAAEAAALVGAQLIGLRRLAAPLAVSPWGRRLLLVGGSVDGARFAPEEVRAMVRASHGAQRIRAALAAVARADLRDAAASLPLPLGVLRGARDPVVRAAVVRALAERRAGLPTGTIPDSGHIPMMERPQAFADALEQMLDALRSESQNMHNCRA
jgi:pimeloyl-ACP methyl ester carboxylesterase